MRGGTINGDRVSAFNELMYLLFALKIISRNRFMAQRVDIHYINPLISSNNLFIDKFQK